MLEFIPFQSCDLNGVRAYSTLDQSGLCTLGTALIDYRGYRVTAQTIIPGTASSFLSGFEEMKRVLPLLTNNRHVFT